MHATDLFLDLFFPAQCVVCGEEGHHWCRRQEESRPWPMCFRCRQPYHGEMRYKSCSFALPLIFVGEYSDPILRKQIYQWKYQGYWRLSKEWAEDLSINLKQLVKPDDILIPIPLHWRRRLMRGFNQASILAHQVSEFSEIKTSDKILIRKRYTQPQATLDDTIRQENIVDAFDCKEMPTDNSRRIWLVDDVVTTGATIKEAIKPLKKCGWKIAGVLAVAKV